MDDIVGKKFNMLTVIKEVEERKGNSIQYLCICDCGKEVIKVGSSVKSGRVKSCGCYIKGRFEEDIKKEIGKKYNKLTVMKNVRKKDQWRLVCKCECGGETITSKNSLVTGQTKSCGCLRDETTGKRAYKHGYSKHELRTTYSMMKDRCYNKKNGRYNRYGGRGIKVCDRWLESIANFIEDMGERPEGCTLDRINNDGNYEPSNCRWADGTTQGTNKQTKSGKLGIKNILLHKGLYCCRVSRYKKERVFYTDSLEDAIKVRDVWIEDFKNDKLLWLNKTETNKYKIEIDDILTSEKR